MESGHRSFSLSEIISSGRNSIFGHLYKGSINKREISFNDPNFNRSRHHKCSNKVYTSKYTRLNMIPLFLVSKFSRYQNAYFLVTGILQLVYPNVPGSRFGIILPLIGILTIDFIKEIISERKLWKSDAIANATPVTYVENGELKIKSCGEVKVGDILKVSCKELFPADMIIISSSDPEGKCYIETSNMDGEINLKIRRSHASTSEYNTLSSVSTLRGSVLTPLPSKVLNAFEGKIVIPSASEEPLSLTNTLFRGAVLAKTSYVFGLVIYTGHETKIFLNNGAPNFKRTEMDRTLNYQIFTLSILLYILSIICSILSARFANNHPFSKYIIVEPLSTTSHALYMFPIFILLYNNIVPLSLIITCEILKVILGKYISSDPEMYYYPAKKFAFSRSSWLLEDLGLINNVFCDKTGTLTCNQITFKAIGIGDVLYTEFPETFSLPRTLPLSSLTSLDDFLKTNGFEAIAASIILLCNEALPMNSDKEPSFIDYITSSIDEEALLRSTSCFDLIYSNLFKDVATIIHTPSKSAIRFKMLSVNPFSSFRRRMSVVVKAPNGKVYLFLKGSDESTYNTLSETCLSSPFSTTTKSNLKKFMSMGHRVLCLAYAEIDESSFESWLQVHKKIVSVAPNGPEVQNSFCKIEKNLEIVGFTICEDKLQDFVSETITMLSTAGIKTWILTGDGVETAINIAKSCSFLRDGMPALKCIGSQKQEVIKALEKALAEFRIMFPLTPPLVLTPFKNLLRKIKNRIKVLLVSISRIISHAARRFRELIRYEHANKLYKKSNLYPDGKKTFSSQKYVGLVITGSALEIIFKDNAASKLFLELAMECKSVVCCSMSPSQKSQVVSLVNQNVKNAVTLAVGDGANDVGMIREANVGVGISGLEGTQAAKSSDFVIYQFYHLSKLIIGHGARSYHSISSFVLYSFYKNILIYTSQIWFQMYNGYSSMSLYETWTSIASYNLIWMFTQPFMVGIYGRVVSTETLMKFPYIYRLGHKREFYNQKKFYKMLVNSLFSSFFIFQIWRLLFTSGYGVFSNSGKSLELYYFGLMIFFTILTTVSTEIILYVIKITPIITIFTMGPVFLFMCSFVSYTVVLPTYTNISKELYGLYNIFNYKIVWVGLLLCLVIRLYLDIIYKYIRREYFPRYYHKFQSKNEMSINYGHQTVAVS